MLLFRRVRKALSEDSQSATTTWASATAFLTSVSVPCLKTAAFERASARKKGTKILSACRSNIREGPSGTGLERICVVRHLRPAGFEGFCPLGPAQRETRY